MPAFREEDCFLPAVELAARIRAKRVSAAAVVGILLKRIERLNGTLNAYVTVDEKGARAAAHVADQAVQHNADLKPLHGVPIAVKDDLAVKGLPCTNGSRLCAGKPVNYDDLVVERLRKAGAIILGKTHLPEFGHKGTTDNVLGPGGARLVTVNPWDVRRTPGGSSGGSAAAVAAGLAFLAVGTDVAGSVRIPASFCGIVGHKPTFGLIPRVPAGNAFSFWVSGPLARTVADVRLALTVLAGPDERDRSCLLDGPEDADPLRDRVGLRVAWCRAPAGVTAEQEVEKAALAALDRLTASGRARVVQYQRPLLSARRSMALKGALQTLFRTECLAELLASAGLKGKAEYDKQADKLSPSFRTFVDAAWKLSLQDYLAAEAAVTEFCEEEAGDWFDGIDLIATPTVAVPAFDKDLEQGPAKIDGRAADPHLDWCFTWLFNLTGHPAVSVPCGWTRDGLPLGLQLVGRRGEDGLVLWAAAALEKAVPWSGRRPKL